VQPSRRLPGTARLRRRPLRPRKPKQSCQKAGEGTIIATSPVPAQHDPRGRKASQNLTVASPCQTGRVLSLLLLVRRARASPSALHCRHALMPLGPPAVPDVRGTKAGPHVGGVFSGFVRFFPVVPRPRPLHSRPLTGGSQSTFSCPLFRVERRTYDTKAQILTIHLLICEPYIDGRALQLQ
jgi:hypothetical protein